jgi:uncharacterized OsmC-like protein
MPSTAHVTLNEGLATTIQIGDFTILSDEPVEDGGTNTGPQATELLLAALGSCAAITLRLYARRKGWDLQRVEIDLSTERYKKSEYPNYTGDEDFVREFKQRITLSGNLTDDQRFRLLEIASKCPVHRALTDPKVMIEEMVDSVIAEETP